MSDNAIGKNESAWNSLFSKYNILDHIADKGKFVISASSIKEFREPRLMAKFDHVVNLPKLFQENNLAILPTARGEYIISHFKAYHRMEQISSEISEFPLPNFLQSLDSTAISSEAIALNCAMASGIIADFLGEPEVYSTVSGRMGSGSFSFQIDSNINDNKFKIDVSGVQIEIDGAFEGVESLALFEAKRDISEDFLIRQLYYPFRVWANKLSKKIRSIFLVYTNGVYRLFEYQFEDIDNYSSVRLVRQKNYSIESTDISFVDIENNLKRVTIQNEPDIAFPQADNFERVINICELLKEQPLNRNQVTARYAFDIRQTNYYTDAARYLGLIEKCIEKRVPFYKLTEMGERILCLNYKARQMAFCECILSHKVFHDVMTFVCEAGRIPDKTKIVQLMKNTKLFNVDSDSTYDRRASTVRGWISWILSLRTE